MSLRVALVVTVKNERALLRSNLLYHHALGVDHAFVFSDGTTDDTISTIQDLSFVTISDSVEPTEYADHPLLQGIARKANVHITARQSLNACRAIEQAGRKDIDWMISLDADELVCPDLTESYEGQLLDFFHHLPRDVEAVRLRTLEVVQRHCHYRNVFAEARLFKLPDAKIQRTVDDPLQHRKWKINGFYGHTEGKYAVRVDVPSVPRTVHNFVSPDGTALHVVDAGYLLHYNCYNFDDFIKKFYNFKKHPDTYMVGTEVEYAPKRLWRDLVNSPDFTLEELSDYYQDSVAFSDRTIAKLSAGKSWVFFPSLPAIVEVTGPADILEDSRPTGTGAPRLETAKS